jgi:hypothetical protein
VDGEIHARLRRGNKHERARNTGNNTRNLSHKIFHTIEFSKTFRESSIARAP